MTAPGSDEATSVSLLMRVRDPRDADAWRTFEAIYRPLIQRYCVRRGVQEADAADVSQEVLVRVSRAIRGFDYSPERGRFRSWLGTVTANELNTFFTRSGSRPEAGAVAALEAAIEPDPMWMDEFTRHILSVARERIRGEFEPQTWAAFEAVWDAKENPADAAKRLGIPIHSVYVNKSRVLKRLEAEVLLLAENLPLP